MYCMCNLYFCSKDNPQTSWITTNIQQTCPRPVMTTSQPDPMWLTKPGVTRPQSHQTCQLHHRQPSHELKWFQLNATSGIGAGLNLFVMTHRLARKAVRPDCDETCRCCWQHRLASHTPLLQSFAWLHRWFQDKGQSSASSTCSFSSSFSPAHSLRNKIQANCSMLLLSTKLVRSIKEDVKKKLSLSFFLPIIGCPPSNRGGSHWTTQESSPTLRILTAWGGSGTSGE